MSILQSELLVHIESHEPEAPALNDGNTVQLNYGQLLHEVQRVKRWLCQHNLSGVAILADNGPSQVILDLACLSVECWTLPIPPFFTKAQQDNALEQSQCHYLLSDSPVENYLDTILITGTTIYLVQLSTKEINQSKLAVPTATRKITFTSGSTGTPRGLCLSEAHLNEPAKSICAAMRPHALQRHLCVLPMAVLLENIAGLYASLFAGIECIVPPLRETGSLLNSAESGQHLVACMQKHKSHSAIVVPALLGAIVHHAVQTSESPDTLRYLAVGGSHVSHSLLNKAKELGLPAYEGYGLSEAGSVVSINLPGKNRLGTVGQVLPHQSILIADDGEIILTHKGFLGYCGNTLGSADMETGGSYPTGDIGYIDTEGYLHISGRKNNLLITSMGRNISPEWIETLLLERPEISQSMVFGDGQQQLSVLLVSNYSRSEINRIINSVNANLPGYAQLGDWRTIEPMTVSNGQLTSNGKIRRETVMKHYTQPQTTAILSSFNSVCSHE